MSVCLSVICDMWLNGAS